MVFVGREEDVVEREKEPVHHLSKRPDDVEQNQKYQAFFCEAGGCVVGCEEGTVESSPEQAEVISHSGWDPWGLDTCTGMTPKK